MENSKKAMFWVSNSKLQPVRNSSATMGSSVTDMPQFPFPSQRLTATTPINGSQVFVYNQFNGSLISEHVFDFVDEKWESGNISVEIG